MDDLFNAFQGKPANQSSGKVVDLKSNILSLYSSPPSGSSNSSTLNAKSGFASNSASNGFADFANFANFAQFNASNSQPESVPKNDRIADFDFLSASSPPKSTTDSIPQASHGNNSLLDLDSIDFHNPPPVTDSKPLTIDFASFSISNNEKPKESSATPASAIVGSKGFSSTKSSISHKMDPALFNHWGNPEPPKPSSPPTTSIVESTTVGSISTPIESIIDSPAVPISFNETHASSFASASGGTAAPVSTNSALNFVDPWSDFQ